MAEEASEYLPDDEEEELGEYANDVCSTQSFDQKLAIPPVIVPPGTLDLGRKSKIGVNKSHAKLVAEVEKARKRFLGFT